MSVKTEPRIEVYQTEVKAKFPIMPEYVIDDDAEPDEQFEQHIAILWWSLPGAPSARFDTIARQLVDEEISELEADELFAIARGDVEIPVAPKEKPLPKIGDDEMQYVNDDGSAKPWVADLPETYRNSSGITRMIEDQQDQRDRAAARQYGISVEEYRKVKEKRENTELPF